MRYSLSAEPSKSLPCGRHRGRPNTFKRMQVELTIEDDDLGKTYRLILEAVPSRAEEAASRMRSAGKVKRGLRPKEAPK